MDNLNGETPEKESSDKGFQGDLPDGSRRKFSKLSAAAPVLMSLASPAVLGAPCLSNMMSGHLYQDRGGCYWGWSPGGWKNLGGSEPNWGSTPYSPGTYNPNATYTKNNGSQQTCGPNKTNEAECYVGGTTLDQTPLAACFPGVTDTLFYLLDNNPGGSTGTFIGHIICALLNASHSGIDYILSVDQLVYYCQFPDQLPEPWSGDLPGFLVHTWEGGPEGQQ